MTTACLLITMLLAVDLPPAVVESPVETRAREFVANFEAGRMDLATKDFNENLSRLVTPELMKAVHEQAYASLGHFVAITELNQWPDANGRMVAAVCKYEKSNAVFRLSFDADNRIASMVLDPLKNEPPDPLLEAAARALLRQFVAGNYEAMSRQFDKKLRAQLQPMKLATLHSQVESSYGKFRSVKESHQINEEKYRTIELIADYERSPVSFKVAFDKTAQVTGVKLTPVAHD